MLPRISKPCGFRGAASGDFIRNPRKGDHYVTEPHTTGETRIRRAILIYVRSSTPFMVLVAFQTCVNRMQVAGATLQIISQPTYSVYLGCDSFSVGAQHRLVFTRPTDPRGVHCGLSIVGKHSLTARVSKAAVGL